MILMSVLTALLFLGGWGLPFLTHKIPYILHSIIIGIKALVIMSFFVSLRVTLPRYRYDLLMSLGWKTFLPLSLSWFLATTFILLDTESLASFGGFNYLFAFYNPSFLFSKDYI